MFASLMSVERQTAYLACNSETWSKSMANKRATGRSAESRNPSPATTSETSTLRPLTISIAMSENNTTSPGSKASSPTDPPKSQIDFHFLNFSHPQDAKASNARKAVRSHVTKQQHQREQKLQQERRAKSFQGTASESSELSAAPRRAHAETFPMERPTTLELPTSVSAGPSSPEVSSAASSPTQAPETQVDLSSLYPEQWLPYVQPILVSSSSCMLKRKA
jgi:hypothetical protein